MHHDCMMKEQEEIWIFHYEKAKKVDKLWPAIEEQIHKKLEVYLEDSWLKYLVYLVKADDTSASRWCPHSILRLWCHHFLWHQPLGYCCCVPPQNCSCSCSEPLFYSLNLLSGIILVAVVAVVCLSSLIFILCYTHVDEKIACHTDHIWTPWPQCV